MQGAPPRFKSLLLPLSLTKAALCIMCMMCMSVLLPATSHAQQKGVDSLIQWIKDHPKPDSLHILTLHRISYRLSETDVKRSFSYYEQVQALSDSLNFGYGKALAQINLGILLTNSANFEASNNAYFKAIEFAEESNGLRLKAVSLNNVGENFKTIKDYDKCRDYTHQAILINTELKAWRGVAINYELLQQCDLEEQRYADARKDLETGLPFAQQVGEGYILSQYDLGFAKLHAVANANDSAEFYFNRALFEARQQNDLRNMFNVYLGKAEYLKSMSAEIKRRVLDSALTIASQTQYMQGQAMAAQQLSLVFDQLNNKDSSLFYYRIYRSASDSLFSENNRRNVIIKESEWMLKRKELENDHLKRITELQQKELTFKNGLLVAGILSLILVILVGVLFYRSVQLKKVRAEALQKQQAAEMQHQLTELEFKTFKAQLNPHFIFNYLNSISGYILLSQPEKASGMVKKFSRMLRTVLHNSEQNEVPLKDDIRTIEEYLELMHEMTTPEFTYKVEATPEIHELLRQVPPLFIQPYVENAIAHGIKASDGDDLFLHVSYAHEGDALVVRIVDNGIGFDMGQTRKIQLMNSKKEVHLGLAMTEKRLRLFAENNGYVASVSIVPAFPGTAQPGTSVTVTIKGFFA